jgi:hypothetical protein
MKFADPNKAVDVIKMPNHKEQLKSVRNQESQLRVFTEEMDRDELGREVYWNSFKAIVKTRSAKKFDRVFEFARYPLPVGQLTDSILSDFFKVFDGKNRHFHVDGDRDLTVLNRWIANVSLDKWIENHAREVFKNKPCSFVVIDKDNSGTPYLIFVDSGRLIDAQFKSKNGDLEYIAFIHSMGKDDKGRDFVKYSVYDDDTFYVFVQYEGNDTFELLSANKHNIGYCPAIAFISQPSNDKNYFKRRVAFSNALSKLEDWTIFDIFRNYVDHYAPFPVTEAPKIKCPNPDCKNGNIRTETLKAETPGLPPTAYVTWDDCPACKDRNDDLIMPGTHIGIQIRPDKTEEDGSGKFRMIFPDTDKMDYVPNKLDDLELEIRHKTVGLNYMQTTNEAMNEMQLKGSFSSMESVLMRTKEELDILYKWIVQTVARLYYKDIVLKVDANFGTEFYLISEDDLQTRFQNAKKMGLPQEEQLMIYKQLIETKYKGNPNKVLRQNMLLDLQPLPLYDTSEVINMKDKGLVDDATLSMKINFLSFVTKFELENGPITQFGIRLDYDKRIEAIRAALDKYNTAAMANLPKPDPAKEPIVQ